MCLNCHLFYLRAYAYMYTTPPKQPKTSRNLRGGESYLIFKQSTKTKTDEKTKSSANNQNLSNKKKPHKRGTYTCVFDTTAKMTNMYKMMITRILCDKYNNIIYQAKR